MHHYLTSSCTVITRDVKEQHSVSLLLTIKDQATHKHRKIILAMSNSLLFEERRVQTINDTSVPNKISIFRRWKGKLLKKNTSERWEGYLFQRCTSELAHIYSVDKFP